MAFVAGAGILPVSESIRFASVSASPQTTVSPSFKGSLGFAAGQPLAKKFFGVSTSLARFEGATSFEAVDTVVRCAISADKKKNIPLNLFRPQNPYEGECISNDLIVGEGAPGETRHIIMNHDGNVPYVEGQSIGIMAPGVDKNGKPHKVRLYSIASTRHGDFGDDKTVSLSVKRLEYTDPNTGELVKGVCSNHLCDLQPGDKVKISGPVGTMMLMPEDTNANIIMLATGTGIAPFRSFLRRQFMETHDDYKFEGLSWLFFGVPYSSTKLYAEELEEIATKNPDNFRLDWAVSREQTTKDGKKMYLQNRMEEYAEELWEMILQDNTYVYMCGLKGMESGIEQTMSALAEKAGTTWTETVRSLKKAGRWHVEVY